MERERILKWVDRFRAGDDAAFDEIYSLLYQRQYYFTFRMLRSRENAEDVVQECFIQVYRNLRDITEPDHFFSWLNRINYNTCINYLKAVSTRELHAEDLSDYEEVLEDKSVCGSPELRAEISEDRNAVGNALNKLSPEMSAAVVMKYYSGLKEEEIAEALSVPVGTVKSRLSRAKKELSSHLVGLYSVFPFFFTAVYMARNSSWLSLSNGIWLTVLKEKIISAAVTATAAAGVAAVLSGAGPAIRKISICDPSIPVHMQHISVEAEGYHGISSVRLNDGTELKKEESGNYTADISENGTYEVRVTDDQEKSAAETVSFSNIDCEKPYMVSAGEQGKEFEAVLADAGSGLDWEKLTLTGKDGENTIIYNVNPEENKVRMQTEDLPAYLYVEDYAGNYEKFEVFKK
jgi:RNA polymerase sigma factor (sigma-70 family)